MNTFFGGIRSIFAAVWRSRLLWIFYALGTLLFLALAWLWLYLPDEKGWQFALTSLFAIALVLDLLWINATALRYFALYHRGESEPLLAPAAARWKHVLMLLPWLVALFLLLRLFDWRDETVYAFSGWLHTSLPASLEARFTPGTFTTLLELKLWFLYWIFVPWLMLPWGSLIVDESGPRGPRRWWRIARNLRYIVMLAIFAVAGSYLPRWISYWAPEFGTMTKEWISMALRLPVAYAIAVTCWFCILSALGFATAKSAEN